MAVVVMEFTEREEDTGPDATGISPVDADRISNS
jgi:hypothetical protein